LAGKVKRHDMVNPLRPRSGFPDLPFSATIRDRGCRAEDFNS
jgi:hypothetical protein